MVLDPVFRPLRASESHVYAKHLMGLDAQARRMRFMGSVSDQTITDYASRAPENDCVIGAWDGDRLIGAIHLTTTGSDEFEIGVSVDVDLRGRGIGKKLIQHGIEWGTRRGMNRLKSLCLPYNMAMRASIVSLGGIIVDDEEETYALLVFASQRTMPDGDHKAGLDQAA